MRYILHIDLNAFFASVEEILNPKLKFKPIVVGGKTSRASVVSCANYNARKFGVKGGMPIYKAKKLCRELIVVSHHFDEYEKYSNIFIDFISQKLTNNIEIMSIDECFVDITHLCSNSKEAFNIAKTIQKRIYNSIGLKCSIGISYNKFLAKMASNFRKPYGITSIFNKKDIEQYIWPLPIEDMFLIGASSSKKLRKYKISIIKDITDKKNIDILKKVFHNQWEIHFCHANGEGNDQLDYSHNIPKSLSNSETFLTDTNNLDEINLKIEELTKSMISRMNYYDLVGRRLSITVKFPDFRVTTKNYSSPKLLSDYFEIVGILKNLYIDNFQNVTIRLIGVGISQLKHNMKPNSMIFDDYIEDDKIIKDQYQIIKKNINDKFKLDIIDIASKKLHR
ncbi:MAG: DNA polymerase IV [Mycoplasma sp.]|nr:DNA polymerase IV [Mycoplasma sp.]